MTPETAHPPARHGYHPSARRGGAAELGGFLPVLTRRPSLVYSAQAFFPVADTASPICPP